MPRRRTGVEELRQTGGNLVDRLAEELRSARDSGQPLIYEQAFPTGKLRVSVIWDDWDRLPLEDRTDIVLRAYELVEGRDSRAKIALASGLTFPEAHASGMLPFQIVPALRRGDPVNMQQCADAMVAEGASILTASDRPQLWFASLAEAEAAQRRLIDRLPASEPIWAIIQEVCKVDDWLQR